MSTTKAFAPRASSILPIIAYTPPSFISTSTLTHPPPTKRVNLLQFPTPLHQTTPPKSIESKVNLFIKRDDATGGVDVGGNKLRKLEFLIADALEDGYDSVVTIGGIQSNHCRATGNVAAMVNLPCHLLLRTPNPSTDPSFTGNLLFSRASGATIHTITPAEYGQYGSNEIVKSLVTRLKESGRSVKPYAIPVGGSNALGTWGYIEAVNELILHNTKSGLKEEIRRQYDHIVFATGSGGTAVGLVMGLTKAFPNVDECPKLHGIAVCDSPDYFYKEMASIALSMGFFSDLQTAEAHFRSRVSIYNGKGKGYSVSTPEEISFIADFAKSTGILLDPVYTGKALYEFCEATKRGENGIVETKREGGKSNVLFWHTGGAVGGFEKGEEFLKLFKPIERFKVG